MLSFRQESEVHWGNYAISEIFPEWFEIKIPIAPIASDPFVWHIWVS